MAVFQGQDISLDMVLDDVELSVGGSFFLPLLLKRDHETTILPNTDQMLGHGDNILFCGSPAAEKRMNWVTGNVDALQDAIRLYNERPPAESAG